MTEKDTFRALKWGSPGQPGFVRNLPMEVVRTTIGILTNMDPFYAGMSEEGKRQALRVLLGERVYRAKTELVLGQTLDEYENRR